MMYLGDIAEDATINFLWSTNNGDGASITRATDGTVQVYKDNGDTESVAGVTDTEDFDGLTGVHLCTIDTSAHAFYATGSDYAVVLKGAVIDGETVNAALAHFSIENRFAEAADALTTYDPPTKAEMDAGHALLVTGGPGGITDTITVTVFGTPVAGVDVWVSTDETGTNVVAGTLQTDANGEVDFNLDIADGYWVWAQKAGYDFADYPKEFNVAAGGFTYA